MLRSIEGTCRAHKDGPALRYPRAICGRCAVIQAAHIALAVVVETLHGHVSSSISSSKSVRSPSHVHVHHAARDQVP